MENWKDIPGFDGRYQVSDQGRVRGTNGVLRPQAISSGYLVVHLYAANVRHVNTVHRLVAAAFVRGAFPGAHVNHKDCAKTNNAAENLEWVTRSQNMQHAAAAGLLRTTRHPVVGSPIGGGPPVTFESQIAAEIAMCGKASSAVHHCLVGKKRSAYGYVWSKA